MKRNQFRQGKKDAKCAARTQAETIEATEENQRQHEFPHIPDVQAARRFQAGNSEVQRVEACSTFTHVAACRLAASPRRRVCLEGPNGFVTSATAPIVPGSSDPVAGWELHPLGNDT